MELYGSLLNISGSVTASTFTGSFIGDGSGLSGIQASGVTGLNLSQISSGNATASISTSGFTVNKNTQIQGNLSVTGALIANEYIVSSSVIYMTTSFASGSSAFGNDNNDIHQFTGSVQISGSISLNGVAIGTGKLDETTFQSYTSSNNSRVSSLETTSGSLNSFTSSINTTIKSKLDSDNVISGSVQVNITGTTGYNTFSSSVATTDLNQENRLNALETSSGSLNSFTSSINTTIKDKLNTENVISSSAQILSNSNIVSSSAQVTEYGFATTGSNLFKGTQTLSGSILPSVDNTYDLGSAEYQWRDVYISSGSLYIDGTKVLSSTAQELTITTDNGQSIKILEGTTDSIILQTADGDIELKSSGDGDILLDPTNGKIMLKGPVEILNGQKIQSSVGGTPVVFANDIVVSGSIDLTGTIDGIDLISFSSSLNTRLGNLETSTGSLNEFTSSTNSRLTSIETSTGSLNSYTSSNNTRLGIIETTTGSLNTYTSSNTTNINAIHIFTGSLNSYTSSNTTNINAIHISTGSLNSYTSSNTTNINDIHTATSSLNSYTSSNNERLSTIETYTGSLNSYTSSNNTKLGIIEGTTGSLNTFTSSANTRLVSIENMTGSYATTGSNIFQGTQIITGSLFISQDLIIAGSSSIQNISSSVLNISDNIITVNAVNPSVRFGGLGVIDSGSSPQVSGSMLYDSVKDEFLFVHQNQGIITSSVLLMGPETFNNVGNEAYITQNRLTKGSGVEHLNDSNITDTGTKVSINSNTEITGTFVVTGTALVSGSGQINITQTTGYSTFSSSISTSIGNLSSSVATTNFNQDSRLNSIEAITGSIGSLNSYTGSNNTIIGTLQVSTGSLNTFTSSINTTIKNRLNAEGVISGSSQISSAGFITGYTETDTLATVTGRGASTSTDLTFNGALTMGTTGTQYIRMGRFPSSTTNSGEAWIGRASDRSVGTMTIQLGTGADRNFEVVDHAWSTVVFNAGMNSITYKNNTVWHAGNDGAASGLDADLLDGSHASAFSPVAGSSSITTVGTIATGVWNGTAIAVANGGTGASTAANAITNLGATTVGGNLFTLTNPSAIRFIRINANNTISTLSDSDFRTAIGAGTSSTTGTVTSVGGTGTVSGLSLSGTVTSTGNLTLGGTLTVAASNFSSQTANTFLAAPNGSSGTPTFRTIVAADVPTLNQNTSGTASNITAYTINQSVGTGNLPTFAGVKGSSYFDAQASSGFRIRNSNDSANAGGYTRRGLWEGNSNYDPGLWAETGYGLYFYSNGSANIRAYFDTSGHLLPGANNTYNLGSASLGWANVYTNDLHLSNMNKPEGNDIDGTNGTWTIQEGAENLYIINNNNGKKYKISLEEIV